MADKATFIKGAEGKVTICVDTFDEDNLWISIRSNHGGAHCYMSHEEAKKMIDALQRLLEVA